MDINGLVRIHDLLQEFPELEEIIVEINPVYRKLKNPVLRKTVGKIATVEQAARAGGIEVTEFVNKLREAVGQELIVSAEIGSETTETAEWTQGEPVESVDGSALLAEGKNPLEIVTAKMKELSTGEFLLLQTDFRPAPMIDNMQKQGHQVVCNGPDEEGQFLTFIRKV